MTCRLVQAQTNDVEVLSDLLDKQILSYVTISIPMVSRHD
jgi:hypothetical protein